MKKNLQKIKKLKDKQEDIFARTAQILGALSAPVRLKLIHFISQAPLSVEVLANKIDQSVANTSMHLRKLLNESIVSVEVVGQKRLYSLHPAMFDFWEDIQDFIQKLDPTLSIGGEVYGDMNWTLPIDNNKDIVFLDVRPDDEIKPHPMQTQKNYMHVSANDLKDKLNLLPKKKKILVVCRGRMCALSAYAVDLLRQNSFNAYRLDKSWFVLNQTLKKKDNL
ncbi:MAG: ArsR family transcriptional regulator [Bacteriovorax sp.]